MEKTSDIFKNYENGENNPFKVPKDYFEEFPTIIQSRIVENKKTLLQNRLFFNFKPQIAIAFASIIIIFFSFISYNLFLENKSQVPLISDEMKEIIELETYDIDEEFLLYALFENEENKEEIVIDNSDLINYLMQNEIDYNIIYSEL